jgi:hypothetical protein
MLGIFRKRTVCSCSEKGPNWSWPFTRAHEKYQDRVVTYVTCLKHAWSVRLYDEKSMRFLSYREELAVVQRMQSFSPVHSLSTGAPPMNTMAPAGV